MLPQSSLQWLGSPTGPSVWASGGLRSRTSGIKEFKTVTGVCGGALLAGGGDEGATV